MKKLSNFIQNLNQRESIKNKRNKRKQERGELKE